jgi:phenylacetate-CoA ligase
MHRWLAGNVFFPLQEWLKGHPTFQILKNMEAADSLTASELTELRDEKLRDLLGYCGAHVPYVRMRFEEAGIQPTEIRTARDLARLPLTRKADVRRHRKQLRSNVAGTLSEIATGGSTGEPLICDLAKRRIASRVACRQRVSKWWGVSVGDDEVALWGSPIELGRQDRLRNFRDWLLATRLLPAFGMDESSMSRYLGMIETIRPRQVFGYPSALYLLSLHSQKHFKSMRQLGVKVVFVTGEVLLPDQRALISETFNCPVANGYGGRDSGFVAHECPQGGMHILSDAVIVEVVDADGRPLGPGERGEIVVTDLYSHEVPFLRYATGDVGVLSARSCPCGRALPLFERIEGRANDAIMTPDGRVINSLAVIYSVREIAGIEHFRIHQTAIDRFHVTIVRSQEFPPDAESRIRRGWTKLFRVPVHVTFEYAPFLQPERSGKFRHVVSELPVAKALGSSPEKSPESGATILPWGPADFQGSVVRSSFDSVKEQA